MGVAIVVLTYDRVHLLRQCVENVIGRTSPLTEEIVIWNNGSSDGTRSYLDMLADPRIRVVHHKQNIGPSAYDRAFRGTTADYLVELDDDMIDAPDHWDETLLNAFQQLPELGLLSANLADNPHDVTARLMYDRDAHLYRVEERKGVRLKVGGPVGGGCAMIARKTYERLGGFGENDKFAYWSSDSVFMAKLRADGLEAAYLNDLELVHAGGPYYSPIPPEKHAFWAYTERRQKRRDRVKRIALRVPFVRSLNAKRAWFVPPDEA